MNFTPYRTTIQTPTFKTILCTILCLAATKSFAQDKPKIHFGIIYPLSTNGTHAPLDTNTLSIHLLAGVSAAERGASIAGISNIVRNDSKGVQIAGVSNHIAKQANGALVAGILNNYGGGDVAAISGFANITKDVKGLQVAGFINKATHINGSQVGGFINKAKDVKGSQIAGFINVAGKVKGTQFAGFINVADSSDYPIGIINLIKNGEKSISLTTDETLTTMLSFRSGGRVLYGIIGMGYNFKNSDEVYAFEAGLGAHLFQTKSFRLNTEIVGIGLESFKTGEYFKTSLRLLPAVKITRNLEIFGGPSLNYLNTNTIEGLKLHKDYISTWENKWGSNFQALYLGYGGGIQYIF